MIIQIQQASQWYQDLEPAYHYIVWSVVFHIQLSRGTNQVENQSEIILSYSLVLASYQFWLETLLIMGDTNVA